MSVAFNPQTGEALRLEGGAWVKTELAENPETGERLAFDGKGWQPVEAQTKGSASLGEAIGKVGGNILDAVGQFGAGFNEGAGAVLSLPRRVGSAVVDAMDDRMARTNAAVRQQMMMDPRFAGQGMSAENADIGPGTFPEMPEPIPERNVMEAIAALAPQPAGPFQRVSRRAGEVVGETLPMIALPPAIGATVPRAGAETAVEAIGPVSRTIQALVRGAGARPGMFVGTEVAASAGAGAGEQGMEEFGFGAGGQMAGALAGGSIPSLITFGPLGLAYRFGKMAGGKYREAGDEALGNAQTGIRRLVGENAKENLAAGVAEGERLRGVVPGFNPSLGEATGDAAAIAQQRGMEAQASGPRLDELAARRTGNVEALDRYAQQNVPAAEGTADDVLAGTVARRDEQLGAVAADEAALTAERQVVAADLPTFDLQEVGSRLRQQVIEERDNARTRMSRMAGTLGLNDVDLTVPWKPFRDRLLADFQERGRFEDLKNYPDLLRAVERVGEMQPGRTSGLVDAAGRSIQTPPQPTTVRFDDIKTLRERITSSLHDELGKASPNRSLVRNLVQLRREVDDALPQMFGELDPTLADRYRQFRTAYFDEYIKPFEKGAAFKARSQGRNDLYQTPDEKVAGLFLKPGAPTAAGQLKAALGDRTAAQTAEAFLLDDLRQFAVRDGVLDGKRYDAWMRRWGSVAKEFPDVLARVGRAGDANQSLLARNAELMARRQNINDSILSRKLRSVQTGGQTPDALIDDALKDPRLMRQVMDSVAGDNRAKDALRRQVWLRGVDDPAKFLTENEAALRIALGTDHLEALRNIFSGRQMLGRMPAPTGRPYEARPLEKLEAWIGMSLPQFANRMYQFHSGWVPKQFLIPDMISRHLRGRSQQRTQAALEKALYDPQSARDFLDIYINRKLKPAPFRRMNAWMFEQGLSNEEATGDEGSPPSSR
jgi:hypothetical protein